MKTDRYTKIVLTVIAVTLLLMASRDLVGMAGAQSGVQKVMLCGRSGFCADVGEITDGRNKGTYVLLVVDTSN